METTAQARPAPDDQDLADVKSVLAGDAEAFTRLVERHGQAVNQQMRGFARDARICEELAQDVFVEAYLGLANFRGDAPFRHWLARLATFTGYKYWRTQRKRGKEVPLTAEWEAAAAEAAAPGEENPGDPEAAARLLYEMLAALPDRDRLLLSLVYLEKCSTAEIAERLDLNRLMVPMRVFKAKLKLKRMANKKHWKEKVKWMIS
jgi:RNA polymerase sigma-70 factor (ECF subfamily)